MAHSIARVPAVLYLLCVAACGQDPPTTPDTDQNVAPTANAGADQEVLEGSRVTLRGTATDPDGTVVAVSWRQVSGPAVDLTTAGESTQSFLAPATNVVVRLTFRFAATDDLGAVTSDDVVIIVGPLPPANLRYPDDIDASVLDQVELVPEVDGFVESFSAATPLPAGLQLDGSTGRLSGVLRFSVDDLVVRIVAENASGADSAEISVTVATSISPPEPTGYTSFDGDALQRFAWVGRNIALLTDRSDLNPGAVEFLLAALDAAYDFYLSGSPHPPADAKSFRGRLTITVVPTTCGAGCGYLGATGIEVLPEYFQVMYDEAVESGRFDQLPFYELGRNFWLYFGILDYVDTSDAVVTGFAVVMRFVSMDRAGLIGAPFGTLGFGEFEAAVRQLVTIYRSGGYTWDSTLAMNQGVANLHGLGAADLFASILLDLEARHAGPSVDLFAGIWRAAWDRPNRTTTADAVDNLVLAACVALQLDVSGFFLDLGWPVSAPALLEAQSYPPP